MRALSELWDACTSPVLDGGWYQGENSGVTTSLGYAKTPVAEECGSNKVSSLVSSLQVHNVCIPMKLKSFVLYKYHHRPTHEIPS